MPEFMTLDPVGVNISDHSIKMIRFERVLKGLRLKEYTNKALPDGAVVRGDIKNKKAVVDVLSKLREEHNLLFVIPSIPEEKGYIFTLNLDTKDPRTISDTVAYRLEENVPLSQDNAIYGYKVLQNPDTVGMAVNVSVLPRTTAEEYLSVFSEAGLIPTAFEMEIHAIQRAIVPRGDMRTHVVIDIGRTRTGVSIVHKGAVGYNSTLELGGDNIIEAIMQHSDIDKKQAETIKQEKGLTGQDRTSDVFGATVGVVASLRDEVMRRIAYWNQSEAEDGSGDPVTHIFLCGGNATTPGLDTYLSQSLKLPTDVANVWVNAFSLDEVIPEIDFNHSLGYAAAIGLSLGAYNQYPRL